ncbi:3696_t:CDS:2, partial [Cetraspora pellucida]
TRKKDFDLSSEKEKTSVLDTKVVNVSHSSKSEPSNSNDKNENSWASNIEQEEKPVGKGKQKVIPSTSEAYKAKNMVTEQEGPSTKVLESNNLEKVVSTDIANDQKVTSEENPNSTSTPNQNSLLVEDNYKNTDDQTLVANLDQDITMEPLDCDKENRTDEKEFTLVTSKKNNRKGNKKKNLITNEDNNKSRTENARTGFSPY